MSHAILLVAIIVLALFLWIVYRNKETSEVRSRSGRSRPDRSRPFRPVKSDSRDSRDCRECAKRKSHKCPPCPPCPQPPQPEPSPYLGRYEGLANQAGYSPYDMTISIDTIIGNKWTGFTEYPNLALGPFKFRVEGEFDPITGVFSMLEWKLLEGDPVGILVDTVYSFTFDSTYNVISGLYFQAAYYVFGNFTLNRV